MQSLHHDTKQVRIEDGFLRKYPGRLVVWWYGPITKNTKAGSVPLAVVFFRHLDDAGNFGDWLQRKVALTHLGLLRIGSVWCHGFREAHVERPVETFDVSFSDDGWSCTSPSDTRDHGLTSPPPEGKYPLRFPRDRNYLLDFKLAGGRNLLVPCMEFFTRCYGHSAEVKRVLATYRWEDAERRLYLPLDEPPPPDTWAVKLARRMRNDDVVFLAHIKYDTYARRVAKTLYSQAEAAPKPGGPDKPYVFLRAIPWFQGPAKLEVAGIPFNGGRSFLGLRILGASQPHGNAVIRDRENRGGLLGTDGLGDQENDSGTVIKRLRSLPDILDLTGDEEPDQGSMSIDIEEDGFKILGEPRTIVDRKTAIERGLVRRTSSGDGIKSVSTGEPHGSGKGVGYGSIHAPVVLESQGALRETWKAARRLAETRRAVVHSVGWFTFDNGVSHSDEPKLIALTPAFDSTNKLKSTWVYHDVAAQTPRGVLVITLEVPTVTVYMLEIQRRASTNVGGEESEESFKGLAIADRDGQDPRVWLRPLLGRIQAEKGIVQRLISECPGRAYAYKHVAALRDSGTFYEASVLNALAMVGVTVPAAARRGAKLRGSP